MAWFKRKPKVTDRQSSARQASFSYYKSGVSPDTTPSSTERRSRERIVAKPKNNRSYKGPAYAFLALIILVLGTLGSYIDTNMIRFSKTRDTEYVKSNDEYIAGIRTILNENLTNRSKLTIDTRNVAARIREVYPEFSNVDINIPLIGTSPSVRASIDEAVLVIDDGSSYNYVSIKGRVIGKMGKDASVAEGLAVIYDSSTLPINLGDSYLASEEIEFITNLRAQAASTSTEIESITLPAVPRELHVRFISFPGIYIKFYTGGDANLQFGTYRAVEKHLTEEGKKPKEYIDVRVEERAFSK